MKTKNLVELSAFLADQSTKLAKCDNTCLGKIIRNSILTDPIREELSKAEEKARKELVSKELQDLEQKVREGKVKQGDPEYKKYVDGVNEFQKKFEEIMQPLMEKDRDVTLEKLSTEEFYMLFNSNSDTMNAEMVKNLWLVLVDESVKPKEESK